MRNVALLLTSRFPKKRKRIWRRVFRRPLRKRWSESWVMPENVCVAGGLSLNSLLVRALEAKFRASSRAARWRKRRHFDRRGSLRLA